MTTTNGNNLAAVRSLCSLCFLFRGRRQALELQHMPDVFGYEFPVYVRV